jgi:hypothetical protein
MLTNGSHLIKAFKGNETAMKLKKIGIFSLMALTVGGFVVSVAQSAAFADGDHSGHFSTSGTSYTVPMDVDGDGPAQSSISTYTGKGSGGQFIGQGVSEFKAHPGTGCKVAPTTQAGCVLNGVSNACEYDSEGGVSANTYQGTKDVQTFKRLSGSICIDFGGGAPYNTDGTVVDAITGGTGRFAHSSGSITTHVWGQILSMDSAGNGFSWYRAEGTMSK